MSMIIDGTNGLTFNNATTQNSGGVVLQVVQGTYATEVSVSNSTFVDSGLTATITPKFATSKILALVTMHCEIDGSTNTGGNLKLLRGSTTIWNGTSAGTMYNYASSGGNLQHSEMIAINYLDSPATTSATTYKTQGNLSVGSTFIMQWQSLVSTLTLMEIAA
jgi:hypothetical protein